jgi:hypothetical protein
MDPVGHEPTTDLRDFRIGAGADIDQPISLAAQLIASSPFSFWTKPEGSVNNHNVLPGLRIGQGWEVRSEVVICGQFATLTLGLSERKRADPLVAEQSFGGQITFQDGNVVALESEQVQDLVVKAAARVADSRQESKQSANHLLNALLENGLSFDWYRLGGKEKSWTEDSFVARVGDMAVALMKPAGPHVLGMNKTWATVYFDKFFRFADPLLPVPVRCQAEACSGDAYEELRSLIAAETPKTRFMSWRDYEAFHPAYNTSRHISIGKLLEQYSNNVLSTNVGERSELEKSI